MARKWTSFSFREASYDYEGASLKRHWGRLHRGDNEPFPKDAEVQEAWRHHHAGDFQEAVNIGTSVGGSGWNAAIEYYQKALKLNPDSAIAHIEYANGLLLLFGKTRIDEATKRYEQAAATEPVDAMERLDVEMARAELA